MNRDDKEHQPRSASRRMLSACVALGALALWAGAASAAPTASGQVHLVEEGAENAGRPLAEVLVTDGYSFTRTDGEGRYGIELHEDARWVAFVNPRGTTPSTRLHHMLPGEAEEIERRDFDFTVTPLAHDSGEPFRFIHHSDLHFGRERQIEPAIERTVRHAARMADPPAFVIDSGDVSIDTRERMQWACEVFDGYDIPTFVVKGNHDKDDDEEYRGQTMEQLFQPLYFAFTYDRYLFLNYPWLTDREQAVAWTEQLLERMDEDHHVVVNMHHWWGLRAGYAEIFEMIQRYDYKAALTGHYHANQVMDVDGLASFAVSKGTPGHIRDLSLPSFNVFTAYPEGRLVADYRTGGFERDVTLVYPGENAPLWRGHESPIQVNAYDTALDVERVGVSVHDPADDDELMRIELAGGGGRAWAGRLAVGSDWPTEVTLRVEATDERGDGWSVAEQRVSVRDTDTLAGVELGGDWGMYQGGPGRHAARESSIAPPLRLAWVHVDRTFGLSAPIVAGGRVFAGVPNNETASEPFPTIVALEAETGEVLWTHEVAGRSVRNTLASDGETLVAQLDDGLVIAVDAHSGERRWAVDDMVRQFERQIHPSGLSFNQMFLRGSPMIDEGHAYLGLRTYGGAIDLDSGELLWHHLPRRGSRSFANPSWTKAGDKLLRPGGTLTALEPGTGEEVWGTEIGRDGAVTPAFDGERVLLPAPPERYDWAVQALDPESGEVLWRTDIEHEARIDRVFSSAAVGPERIYFPFGRSGRVHAFDKASGELVWSVDGLAGDRGFRLEASAVLAGDYLYVVNTNGRLHAIDAASGNVVWHYDLDTKVSSGLAISGNTLLVTGRNGALYAFVPAPATPE